MTRLTEQRLEAARREHEIATDELIDFVVDSVALLANVDLRERADLLKRRLSQAARGRDNAKIDHITALVLGRDHHERQRVRENRDVLRELCARVANIEATMGIAVATPECDRVFGAEPPAGPRVPPPGHSDPDDPTGRG